MVRNGTDSELGSLGRDVQAQQHARNNEDRRTYKHVEFTCLLDSSVNSTRNDVDTRIQKDFNANSDPNTEKKGSVKYPQNVNLCTKINQFNSKFKSDLTFRHKFLYSVFLVWSFFILGWMLGQVGPSLLDLELITSVTLETAAFYVTSLCAGYMAGSLLSGLLYDRMNKFFLMWLFLIGLSGTVALVPWCTHYIGMLIIQFLVGIFQGCIDTVSCAEMVSIWNKKTSQSFMQALHFGFAAGGIISPLITAPFLAQRSTPETIESPNSSNVLMTSTVTYQDINLSTFKYNDLITTQYNNLSLDSVSTGDTLGASWSNGVSEEYETSRVHIAYAISGSVAFLVSLPFLIMYIRMPSDFERHGCEDRKRSNNPLPLLIKISVLINMCALSALYTGLEETFVEFLSAFCVEQVRWTKTQGSLATSLYFGSIGLGHFINIFTVRIVNHVKLMGLNCFMLIIAMTVITLSADNVFHAGVWVAPPLVGLSLSIIYPIIFTWTEDIFLPVTGRISSLFILTGAMGSMINPMILGVLMDEHSPMWYCYLLLIESILQLVFYLSGLALQRFVKTRFHNVNTHTADSNSNC